MEQQMLKNKVAIITGASYGMGQAMAELFAEEGAAVVITARGKEKLDVVVEGIRKKGGKAVGVVADVCSTEDTRRVFETALKEFFPAQERRGYHQRIFCQRNSSFLRGNLHFHQRGFEYAHQECSHAAHRHQYPL